MYCCAIVMTEVTRKLVFLIRMQQDMCEILRLYQANARLMVTELSVSADASLHVQVVHFSGTESKLQVDVRGLRDTGD